jgi:hypothetical protein
MSAKPRLFDTDEEVAEWRERATYRWEIAFRSERGLTVPEITKILKAIAVIDQYATVTGGLQSELDAKARGPLGESNKGD